jgi:hypothetical protein
MWGDYMELEYTITRDLYIELIEFQMNLAKNKLSNIISFWVFNTLFLGIALYFFIVREYSLIVRITPIGMATILFLIGIYRRRFISFRAKNTFKIYQKLGILQNDFLGKHYLKITESEIILKYGKKVYRLDNYDMPNVVTLKDIVIIVAKGVVFELIPLEYTEKNNINLETINIGDKNKFKEVEEQFPGALKRIIKWEFNFRDYLRAIITGDRLFFTTNKFWKSRGLIRVAILIYAVILLFTQANIYLKSAFIIAGVILNLNLIVLMSPLAYYINSRRYKRFFLNSNNNLQEIYQSDNEIVVIIFNKLLRCKFKDIIAIRKTKKFGYMYTRNGKVFVVPYSVFSSKKEIDSFFNFVTR